MNVKYQEAEPANDDNSKKKMLINEGIHECRYIFKI